MKALKIIFTLFILFWFNLAFWLDAPQNIVLEKATDNSLDLSWDKVDWAWVYSISYWETTASGSIYDNDQAEIFSTNSGTINNLKSNTKYFIAVKAYDDNENESDYSKEVSFSTLDKLKELKIDSVEVVDTRNFNIKFNLELDKDSVASLNIVNSWDDLEDVEVEKYKIENNTLKVFLTKDLKLNSKYSVTVITLKWANWETITAWVDWISEFIIDENTKTYTETTENTDLNSAWTWIVEKTDSKVLWGKDLENNNVVTETAAKQKEKLPTTWPTETFLFLVFALIAWWLFMNLRRKTSL